ncbi:MAG TPA: DUF167 domain-containing protein [Thermomicrobiales bacterium]|nr:DUF167 domain-containing protein [Thermomicrobiales bacterium]
MTTSANRASGVSKHDRGSALSVIVVPRSARSSLDQLADGVIQVRVAAPPSDGAANAALLRFLAGALDVPRSCLAIISGASSRRKRISVAGLTPDELETRLHAALYERG